MNIFAIQSAPFVMGSVEAYLTYLETNQLPGDISKSDGRTVMQTAVHNVENTPDIPHAVVYVEDCGTIISFLTHSKKAYQPVTYIETVGDSLMIYQTVNGGYSMLYLPISENGKNFIKQQIKMSIYNSSEHRDNIVKLTPPYVFGIISENETLKTAFKSNATTSELTGNKLQNRPSKDAGQLSEFSILFMAKANSELGDFGSLMITDYSIETSNNISKTDIISRTNAVVYSEECRGDFKVTGNLNWSKKPAKRLLKNAFNVFGTITEELYFIGIVMPEKTVNARSSNDLIERFPDGFEIRGYTCVKK